MSNPSMPDASDSFAGNSQIDQAQLVASFVQI